MKKYWEMKRACVLYLTTCFVESSLKGQNIMLFFIRSFYFVQSWWWCWWWYTLFRKIVSILLFCLEKILKMSIHLTSIYHQLVKWFPLLCRIKLYYYVHPKISGESIPNNKNERDQPRITTKWVTWDMMTFLFENRNVFPFPLTQTYIPCNIYIFPVYFTYQVAWHFCFHFPVYR